MESRSLSPTFPDFSEKYLNIMSRKRGDIVAAVRKRRSRAFTILALRSSHNRSGLNRL